MGGPMATIPGGMATMPPSSPMGPMSTMPFGSPMGPMGPMGTVPPGAIPPGGPVALGPNMASLAAPPPPMGSAPPPFMGAPCRPCGPPPPPFPAPAMGPMPSGPCGCPMGPMGPPMIPPDVVIDRFATADVKHDQLRANLDANSNGMFSKKEYKRGLMAAGQPGLDDVDWRVPRLMHCKDPKYNILALSQGPYAEGIQEAKAAQGRVLEDQLAAEAFQKSLMEFENSGGRKPPPEETIVKPGVEFYKAVPQYHYEDDLWQRRLELKSLQDAMEGDIRVSMPRPVVLSQDYDNFREGKYV